PEEQEGDVDAEGAGVGVHAEADTEDPRPGAGRFFRFVSHQSAPISMVSWSLSHRPVSTTAAYSSAPACSSPSAAWTTRQAPAGGRARSQAPFSHRRITALSASARTPRPSAAGAPSEAMAERRRTGSG